MEWLIQIIAIILSLLLAAVKSIRYQPNNLSEFELDRQVKAGSDAETTVDIDGDERPGADGAFDVGFDELP